MKISISKLCGLLYDNDRYLILTHNHPDCDTLGSALALTRLLQSLGKTAYAVCPDAITEKQKRLMGGYGFEYNGEPYHHIITTDVAAASMLGKYESLKDRILLKIDHHRVRENFGKYQYVKDASASCAEIIFDICVYFERKGLYCMSADVASYIYCGISSDTGGFRYSNTTSETHKKAARLFQCGIPAAQIDEELHILRSPGRIRAEGYALSNIRYDLHGKIASVCFDMKTRKRLDLMEEDIADIVDVPRSAEGVETAFSVKEEPDGSFRVSLRSRQTDCSAVAAAFGGGGHIRASGCTLHADSIEKARDGIIKECVKQTES